MFNFPSINAGQTYTENSSFAYGYTPAWSGGGVSAHAGLTANANFVYDLGPFSGNDSIFKTAVDTYASGGIGGRIDSDRWNGQRSGLGTELRAILWAPAPSSLPRPSASPSD